MIPCTRLYEGTQTGACRDTYMIGSACYACGDTPTPSSTHIWITHTHTHTAYQITRTYMQVGYERTSQDSNILGTVVLDSLGEHVPPRRQESYGTVRFVRRQHIAYISNLAVAVEARRGGVGRALLECCEKVWVGGLWSVREGGILVLVCVPLGTPHSFNPHSLHHALYIHCLSPSLWCSSLPCFTQPPY